MLQGFDDMSQQAQLALGGIGNENAVLDKKVADHALAALVDEERITKDFAAFDGGVAGKDFRIDVAQDHLRRAAVIPREQARPNLCLVLQQGAQIGGGKMPEVENLQGAPAKAGSIARRQESEFSGFARQRQTMRTLDGNMA